jgi:metal-responsive CopG/Arc/MetJ family transcriptional regulator
LTKIPRWNTLVSFKLAGTHLQKLDQYCNSHKVTRSELLREIVGNLVEEKRAEEEEAVSG